VTADVLLIAAEVKASTSAVCRALELPRSSVYARRSWKPGSRELANRKLDVEIAAIFQEHKGRYGAPRVHRVLSEKYHISRKRVAARMRLQGLQARRPRRFRKTTQVDPSKVVAPNLLDRKFERKRPDEAWVGDISYVWTRAGWVYLAILVDLCERAIVGWAVSTNCDTSLALKALETAVARRRPPPGLMHHTDRGSTYTATDYQTRLRTLGMVVSMSRKGNCWDNAVAESTFATIKAELLPDAIPKDIHGLEESLFEYIDLYYNRRRLHSTLGYKTPEQHAINTTARGAHPA
jgi:transposase InsO family protein